jgi:hypothetical protein
MRSKGNTVVEVIVAASILAVVAVAFLATFATITQFHEKDMLMIKGGLLAEEGIETVRLIKSNGWPSLASLTPDTPYYFELGTSTWSVTTTPELVDGAFYRYFKVSQVMRDASEDIVSVGGVVDPNTFLIESNVSWQWRGATSTVIYDSYMTNL